MAHPTMPANPFKVADLAYIMFGRDGDDPPRGDNEPVYRKIAHGTLYGIPHYMGDDPVTLPGMTHTFYRSSPNRELVRFVDEPTRESRSYSIAKKQIAKFIGFGEGAGGPPYPIGTGTSKPGVICMTDGMATCIAVAIGGRTANLKQERSRCFIF